MKRRKAMTTEEAIAYTSSASTAVLHRTLVPRGIPRKMTVTLKYYENLAPDPAAGACVAYAFRANSCYDPYVPAGGHQPRGLDQYFNLYDKAVITVSKVTVKCLQPIAGSCGLFGVSLRNDSATEVTPVLYIEDAKSTWAAVGNASSVNQECVLDFNHKWFGPREPAIDDAECHFTSSGDASKVAYYHVWYGAETAAANPPIATLNVFIEYTITFFEPNTLPIS